MEPRAVRTKQEFVWSGAFYCLNNIVETSHARSIREDVRVMDELVHNLLMRTPIISKAP